MRFFLPLTIIFVLSLRWDPPPPPPPVDHRAEREARRQIVIHVDDCKIFGWDHCRGLK